MRLFQNVNWKKIVKTKFKWTWKKFYRNWYDWRTALEKEYKINKSTFSTFLSFSLPKMTSRTKGEVRGSMILWCQYYVLSNESVTMREGEVYNCVTSLYGSKGSKFKLLYRSNNGSGLLILFFDFRFFSSQLLKYVETPNWSFSLSPFKWMEVKWNK